MTATTSTLNLSALGKNSGGLVLVRTKAKVSDGLSLVSVTLDKGGVLASGGAASKLVKSENLTTSLQNASTGSASDTEGGNSQLGEFQKTSIVSNGADNNKNVLARDFAILDCSSKITSGNRWSVGLGKVKRLKKLLVELRLGTTSQNTVK